MPADKLTVEHTNQSFEAEVQLPVEIIIERAKSVTGPSEHGECDYDLYLRAEDITLVVCGREIPLLNFEIEVAEYIYEICEEHIWEYLHK